MFYKIVEVTQEEQSNLLYVLVHFWRTKQAHDRRQKPYVVNEFLMQFAFDEDVPSQIKRNIFAYWGRAKARKFSRDRDQRIRGIIGEAHSDVRAGVSALRGATFEEK